ncbi:MAG: PEP-CTERM sorting domain-containing protein [Verrucomicrobiales bacterium]
MKKTLMASSALGLGLTLSSPGMVTLYDSFEDFNNGTGSTGNNITVAGWEGYFGHAGTTPVNRTVLTPSGLPTTHRGGLFDGTNSSSGTSVNDYIYFQSANSADGGDSAMNYFAHTSTGSVFTAFDASDYATDLTANWVQGRSGSTSDYRLAVQVGGTWYANDSDIGGGNGSRTFDLNGQDWVEITSVSGSPLSLGGTSTDSATLFGLGDVTGVGFYAAQHGTGVTLRIDNFTLTGVPEPSALFLSLGALGAFFIRQRS